MKTKEFLSDEAIREDYENLVFEKVMAIHCEKESTEIAKEITEEKTGTVKNNVIEKLFKKKERKENRKLLLNFAKKAFVFTAAFFFVIALSLSSAVFAFADVREYVKETVYNLVYLKDEKYTQISAGENLGFVNPEIYDWEGAFAPTYMPSGYSLINRVDLPDAHVFEFSNGVNSMVFMQFTSSDYQINTEDPEKLEYISVNESEAIFVIKNGVTSVSWRIGDTMFRLNTDDKNIDLIKIAEGIKLLK